MVTKFGVKNPWPKRSALLGSKVMQGSTKGQIALKYPMVTKFGGKNHWPKCNALLGQRSCRGQLGSSRGQFA